MNEKAVRCASRISAVTVYARGATVRRIVDVDAVGPTVSSLSVELSPLAEPGSVRVELLGRILLGTRFRVVTPESGEIAAELSEKLWLAQREQERLEAELQAARERDSGLSAVEPKPLGRRANEQSAERFADALAVLALVDDLRDQLDESVDLLVRAVEEQKHEVARLEQEMREARSSEQVGQGYPHAELSLSLGEGQAIERLELEYAIPTARWWPAYSLRIGSEEGRAELSLDAFVSQCSLEDWTGVRLSLSTADLQRSIELPKLPAWRLGRAQPPKATGYRPLPDDLEQLFEGYDRTMRTASPLPPPSPPMVEPQPCVVDEDEECDDYAPADLPGAKLAEEASYGEMRKEMASPPAPSAAPMRLMAKKKASLLPSMSRAVGGAARASMMRDEAPAEELSMVLDVGGDWLDFDGLQLTSSARGRLTRRAKLGAERWLRQAQTELDAVALPRDVADPLAARGSFDHIYHGATRVDVPSSPRLHRLSLKQESAPSHSVFRAVPLLSLEVFREVLVDNPFAAPLLAGPVDVFIGSALLCTTRLSAVDRGGRLRVGLGVEERLRVSRNVRVDEGSAGIFGGTVVVTHEHSIELASALGFDTEVEVLDRMPISTDEEIELTLKSSEPKSEPYEQAELGSPVRGGRRWKLALPAGQKRSIAWAYTLSYPTKREIIGGNRRD
ncbi:MAG: DUF4139 domain-containing protein [Myxococcota bacterium]|nr:DUF4139 domain-containing protein [Myxococcota bacterium]